MGAVYILDCFDYYDYNYTIDERAKYLRAIILNGNYQPSQPLIYRIEKKFGICRHLVIPQPLDALVLQVITENICTQILKSQPSENAYYSRDKHNMRKPHEIDDYGFHWKTLWKKMQKQIYKFKEDKELIVVTDLSNYYDSIYMPELRKVISSFIDKKESVLDILFKIIEKISWVPDYLPYTGRGLPTTNLEGIRLLAHSFVFEIDEVLKEKSNESFTRWMDDIIIGVNSRDEAVNILSSTSDMLKSRGLALNLKKTSIYSAQEAEFHFLIKENKYLDNIDFDYHKKNGISKLSLELDRKLAKHLNENQDAKYSEKITKRYITAFTKINSKRLLKRLPELFNKLPGVRQNLLYYLTALGYSKRTSDIVLKLLDHLQLHDDISLFNVCKLITDWEVPLSKEAKEFIQSFIAKVKHFSIKRKKPFDFYCLVWIRTKYDHPDELIQFIVKYENIWKKHPFLRRQITSIMSRVLIYRKEWVTKFLQKQIATSETQVVSVANAILSFSEFDRIEKKL